MFRSDFLRGYWYYFQTISVTDCHQRDFCHTWLESCWTVTSVKSNHLHLWGCANIPPRSREQTLNVIIEARERRGASAVPCYQKRQKVPASAMSGVMQHTVNWSGRNVERMNEFKFMQYVHTFHTVSLDLVKYVEYPKNHHDGHLSTLLFWSLSCSGKNSQT